MLNSWSQIWLESLTSSKLDQTFYSFKVSNVHHMDGILQPWIGEVSRWGGEGSPNRRLLISLICSLTQRAPVWGRPPNNTKTQNTQCTLFCVTMSPFALELRYHLVEHVSGPPLGRAGCRHISCFLPLHLCSCSHSLLLKSNPSPPFPISTLFLTVRKKKGGGCQSTPPSLLQKSPPPPSPPQPPPSPPACSLLLPHSLVGRGWRNPPHPSPIPTLPRKQFSKSESVTSVKFHVWGVI